MGAVSVMNRGRVWVKNDLHPDLKLVVASLATSMLLRHNMEAAAQAGK
jgi:hypothetical protein